MIALFLAALVLQTPPAPALPFNAVRIDEQSGLPQARPIHFYNWLSEKSYPKGPFKRKVDGTVGITILVDANGRFQQCKVYLSSGDSELDVGTCAAILKVKPTFYPALNSEGKAVAGAWSRKVNWVLPRLPR